MLTRAYYIICVLSLILLTCDGAKAEFRYRLHLDGKPGSDYAMLSPRAEERRLRLGIERDSADLEVSPLYLQSLAEYGLQVVTRSRWLNTVVVMQVNGQKIEESVWQELPFVSSVDLITTTQRATTPMRCGHLVAETELDGLDPNPQIGNDDYRAPLMQLNAMKSLYEAGYRGQGMLIAVLDAGFVKVDKFEWLRDRVVGSWDMFCTDQSQSKVYQDESHGTCCLSIMATPQSHGVWGSAQDAEYYLVRTETNDSETELEEDMWVAGAELADSLGVDIISSSLGYYEFDSGLESHTQAEFAQYTTHISQGARVACQKGILVCNAAGNEADNQWKRLIFPADVEDVLTVGGIRPTGSVASFSSRGFTVPYVKPDVMARATQCYTVNVNSSTGQATSSGAGTSYATPLIAGLCASLWSAVPELTPAQLRDAVRQSASRYEHPDSIRGYGKPDFKKALELAREWTGHQEDEAIAVVQTDKVPVLQRYSLFGLRIRNDNNPDGVIIEQGNRLIYRRK